DTGLLRFLHLAAELSNRHLGGITSRGEQLLPPSVELILDLDFLRGGAAEEGNPVLVEGGRGSGRGGAGGRQLLALQIGVFGGIESDLAGVALSREHLGPGDVEILLGKGLAHLLDEDQGGDQREGPQDDPDPERILAQESKSCY